MSLEALFSQLDAKESHHFLRISAAGCIGNKEEIYEPPDITTATGNEFSYADAYITNIKAANTMNLDEKLTYRDNEGCLWVFQITESCNSSRTV